MSFVGDFLKAGVDWTEDGLRFLNRISMKGTSESVGGTTVTVYMRDENDRPLLCSGTTVPTDAGSGYAKGCIFIKTDASSGVEGIYVNRGTTSSCLFKVAGDVVLNSMLTKTEKALSDADATLSAADVVGKGIFKITPTAARTLTTDTAAHLIAQMVGYQTGSWFQFHIVNLAAQDVTLAAGAGVTIVGSAVVNNASATFIGVITSASAVSIYRV